MPNLQIFPAARITTKIVAIEEVPTLGDIHAPGSTRTTALQPASVATGPPLSATGDESMSASLEGPAPESTGASSTGSPATPGMAPLSPAPKAASRSPPSYMELIKHHDGVSAQPRSVIRESVIQVHAKPKFQLPTRLPSRPTMNKFAAFSWGPFTIYHGGQRAPYRLRDNRIGKNTKLFQKWADLCEHIVRD